ncbi:MAG: hypothetical protein FGM15_12725 [Chthoniobacterales bacterium]|nr:hypothetical protein [Chthoniobacterales bacterium]
MTTLTIILITAAAAIVVVLAWLGGYEIGMNSGIDAERKLANKRVNGVLDHCRDIQVALDDLSRRKRRPKSAKNRRKASRKVVAA